MESSAKDLLSELLSGPYLHFRQVGADDWRDPSEKNAGFSLSSKGFRDHRSGESGGLHELAKKHDLAFPNGHPPIDKGNRAQFVWDKSDVLMISSRRHTGWSQPISTNTVESLLRTSLIYSV